MFVNNDEKIFVYKLTSDNGGAPCVYKNKLSLCICKPGIRVSAREKDWIIGFGGKSIHDLSNRLIYIAQITKIPKKNDYYKNSEFADRPDCIYQWEEYKNKFELKKCAVFHNKHNENCLEHDLGKCPDYKRAFSLLSDKFVYLGKTPVDRYKTLFDKIKSIYDSPNRNFKINFSSKERESLVEFIEGIFNCFGYGEKGEPTHAVT